MCRIIVSWPTSLSWTSSCTTEVALPPRTLLPSLQSWFPSSLCCTRLDQTHWRVPATTYIREVRNLLSEIFFFLIYGPVLNSVYSVVCRCVRTRECRCSSKHTAEDTGEQWGSWCGTAVVEDRWVVGSCHYWFHKHSNISAKPRNRTIHISQGTFVWCNIRYFK